MIIQVYDDDMLNGVGLREVVFLQGCPHQCDGCFNQSTWEFKDDTLETSTKTINFKNRVEAKLKNDYIDGITITGGDPLAESNVVETQSLINLAKKYNKTVWVYTGYTYEYVLDKYRYLLEDIDVLCDGPFIKSLLSPEKPWVGSSNQRVIDVQKSLKENKIIEYES